MRLTSAHASGGRFSVSATDGPDYFDVLVKNCEQPGWDGDEGLPITSATARVARLVYGRIPHSLLPHIAPAGDGTIGFEFLNRPGSIRKLFIEARPDGTARAYYVSPDSTFTKFSPRSPIVLMDDLAGAIRAMVQEARLG